MTFALLFNSLFVLSATAASPTPLSAAAALKATTGFPQRKPIDPSQAAVQQAHQVSSVTPLILQLKALLNRKHITQPDYDTVAKHALLLEGPSGGGKQYVLQQLKDWVEVGKLSQQVGGSTHGR
jgi:hypothetical protein